MRQLTPLVAALLLVVACTSGGGTDADPSPGASPLPTEPATTCSPVRDFTDGFSTRPIAVSEVQRSYGLYVPSSYDGASEWPLVVLFHGAGQSVELFATQTNFNTAADEHGFIAAYPEASPGSRWNAAQALDAADDAGFVNALLDALEDELCINQQAIFVAGFSDGGGMAQRMACIAPERVRAVGTVAAAYVGCRSAVPWMAFHGMADTVAPFEGGALADELGGGTALPARRVLSDWSRELGCDALGVISRPTDAVELTLFPRCTMGYGEAQLYAIIDGGHEWPGADGGSVSGGSNQIAATSTLWEFFAAHAPEAAGQPADASGQD